MMGQDQVGIGQLVYSRAGRDSGRWFVVVGLIDDRHVLIADGDLRRAARPKRKNLRHLEPSGIVLAEVVQAGQRGMPIADSVVRQLIEEQVSKSRETAGEEVGSVDG